MKTTLHSLRREKKINYSNYHFALALYTIIKKKVRKKRNFRLAILEIISLKKNIALQD